MNKLTPKRMFFTKGVGYHRNKLQSFELALRHAGIEKCNLVYVSSISPLDCKIISKKDCISNAGVHRKLGARSINYVRHANRSRQNVLQNPRTGLTSSRPCLFFYKIKP